MGVLLVVGFVFFFQDTGGRAGTLCFVIVILLSFVSRDAGTRSNQVESSHSPR